MPDLVLQHSCRPHASQAKSCCPSAAALSQGQLRDVPGSCQSGSGACTAHCTRATYRSLQVGQFNLGFIVARLGGHLFIIDQHASDEKRNFERLQARPVASGSMCQKFMLFSTG